MSAGTMHADVVVVGLGAMGAATLYQLARRGVSAIGVDRYRPPHALGSSTGETRVTRAVVGEGNEYVPLVLRSHQIWRELEHDTGEDLLRQVGFLTIGTPGEQPMFHGAVDLFGRTMDIARRHGLPIESLDAPEIVRRFPLFDVRGDEVALFDPQGGYVRPERCVAVQIGRAETLGARLLMGTAIRGFTQHAGGVTVETDAGPIHADRAVLSLGAWAGALLGPPFDRLLIPYRQTLHWFAVQPELTAIAEAAPTFVWMHGGHADDQFYGFPPLPGTGESKVATERYDRRSDPDSEPRDATREEQAAMRQVHLAGRIKGLAPMPVRSSVCLYTVTPDFGFLIDRHPSMDRVLVVSPCSGHGFKHSGAIGEAVAELVTEGASTIDLSAFALSRFASRPF